MTERPSKTNVRRVDHREIAYRQGMRAFNEGYPRPDNSWPDEEWRGHLNEGQCRWLGYMMARGLKILAEIKSQDTVRDYLEFGVDLPPDFNND
jgi:hypothetical protein